MYFTCQVVKYPIISESELSNLRMFTLPSVLWANKMQSSLPVLWGGCVMHKALKVPVYSDWTFEILGHRS